MARNTIDVQISSAVNRIRIEHIRLPANVTAGMNALRLCALAYRLRGSTDDVEDPITVRPDGDGWRIIDGRHRYIAAVIAGRPDIPCHILDEPTSPTARRDLDAPDVIAVKVDGKYHHPHDVVTVHVAPPED